MYYYCTSQFRWQIIFQVPPGINPEFRHKAITICIVTNTYAVVVSCLSKYIYLTTWLTPVILDVDNVKQCTQIENI